MANKKMVLGIALLIMAMVSGCAQKYNDEKDFEAKPVDGGKGVEITKYIGEKFEVHIPPRIQKLPVVRIGEGAFAERNDRIADSYRNFDKIISITIPNTVTSIGQVAFSACTSLTSVTFQGTITADNFDDPFGSSFGYINGVRGDLRDKYLAGGKGTYTRDNGSNTWTKK